MIQGLSKLRRDGWYHANTQSSENCSLIADDKVLKRWR
jgi:hypothetical protein